MQKFQINANQYACLDNTYGDNRNFGCLDEFWHKANPHSQQIQSIRAVEEQLKKDGYVDLQVKQLNLTVLEHFTIFNEYAGLIPSGCNAEVIKHVHWSANTSLDLPALPYSKIMWTSKHTCWMVNSSTFEAVQQHAADFTHHLFGHMVLRTFTLKTLCARMVSMDRSAAKCGSQQVLPKRMLQTSRVGFTQ